VDSIEKDSKPGQPDNMDDLKSETGDYQFNLGLHRIDTLNSIINACARKYHKALNKQEEKYVREYQNMVNVLYTEAFVYMEDDTEFDFDIIETDTSEKQEVLRQILDHDEEFNSEDDLMLHLQQVRSIYLGVRELMKNVGLDIPREDKIGQTDIFNK